MQKAIKAYWRSLNSKSKHHEAESPDTCRADGPVAYALGLRFLRSCMLLGASRFWEWGGASVYPLSLGLQPDL